jgi:Outer membrane protein beta-barrel domain
MSNLKDNDLDDLFRRASEKYPLRTDSSDWDRMAAALEKDEHRGLADDPNDPGKRRSRRFLWLFLLLPLAGAGYYTWRQSATNARQSAGVTSTQAGTNATSTSAANTSANTARNGGKSATPDRLSAASASRQTGTSASTSRSVQTDGNQPAHRDLVTSGHTRTRHPGQATGDASAIDPDVPAFTQDAPALTPGTPGTPGAPPATGTTGAHQPASAGLPFNWIDPLRARTIDPWQLDVDVKAPPKTTETKQQASPKAKSSFLYAGVIVAPDASMVRMQSVKGVGSTFGILLGYAFDKHWSVETGAYLDRKKYYTSGEYFNTEKVRLPQGSNLLDVNGTCTMWEIPLSVRYNFNPEGRLHWFATAGFSTYLMTGEKYTYAYEYPGYSWGQDSTWNIKKPSQYPFGVINLSVGLEQRLGKIGFLRLEPYAKIPLTGMGTGKLPIMSTGVNIGFVRPLWK